MGEVQFVLLAYNILQIPCYLFLQFMHSSSIIKLQGQGYYVVGHCNLFCKRQKHTAPDIEKNDFAKRNARSFFCSANYPFPA